MENWEETHAILPSSVIWPWYTSRLPSIADLAAAAALATSFASLARLRICESALTSMTTDHPHVA